MRLSDIFIGCATLRDAVYECSATREVTERVRKGMTSRESWKSCKVPFSRHAFVSNVGPVNYDVHVGPVQSQSYKTGALTCNMQIATNGLYCLITDTGENLPARAASKYHRQQWLSSRTGVNNYHHHLNQCGCYQYCSSVRATGGLIT